MTQKPMTVMELAQRWGCTRQAIYAIIKDGKLRTFRVGGKLIRILPEEVLKWESGGGSMPLESLEQFSGLGSTSLAPAMDPFV